MISNYPLHLPEDQTPGHCLATFSTAITCMALELGTYVDLQMRAKFGDGWFGAIEAKRKAEKPHYKISYSCYDFSWLFSEPTRNTDSPIRALLPTGIHRFFQDMDQLRDMRNRWYHDHNPHNINELRKALDLVAYIAEKCGLELADNIKPVIDRVKQLKAGTYDKAETSTSKPQEINEIPHSHQPMKQAAVGAKWIGIKGEKKLELRSSGTLVDINEGINVTAALTEWQRDRYLPLWQKLEIDWLWVDTNGAVAAYVDGDLLMVGEFGADAVQVEQDPFAKFLLKSSYSHSGKFFFDTESETPLNLEILDATTKQTISKAFDLVEENEIMRLTWDGDLISFTESGAVYIGKVSSASWFTDHFLLPTHP